MLENHEHFTKKTANHLKKIRKITKSSTMSLITLTKSSRGKGAIIDNNYHKYTFNSMGKCLLLDLCKNTVVECNWTGSASKYSKEGENYGKSSTS